MNPNWPYRYRNWSYQIRNWSYRYTDYSTSFVVNQSLSEFMKSLTHIDCSSGFLSQETGTDTFLWAMQSSSSFSLYQFLLQGSFFFGQSSKSLSADHLRCEHKTLLHGYFRQTCFVHTPRPRTAWRTLHKARAFSCNPIHVRLARIMSNFTSQFLPATI